MYTLEKNNTSPFCILCTLMPQIIPLLTFMPIHTWYEDLPLLGGGVGGMSKWEVILFLLCWVLM